MAVEPATPVPPNVVGKAPVTAPTPDRFTALKNGVVPSDGTVKLWYADPATVESMDPPPLPKITPLALKLPPPVPPRTTGRVPSEMMEAGRPGISLGESGKPLMTRPLASTFTFGYTPAITPLAARMGLG